MRRISLFPVTAEVDRGHLVLGGCDCAELATQFGTPLYVFDEATLRERCAQYVREFCQRYPDTLIIYACKAFINRALALIFMEEGLGLDVVSGGELTIARAAGFPRERVYFHGNNKSRQELELAVGWGVGRIVVDNFHELSLLEEVAKGAGASQKVLLRLSPGVDPHTHAYITTGAVDTKFGFPMAHAEEAVARALGSDFELLGLHFHLGSQILDLEPYTEAIGIVLRFAAEMRTKYGFRLQEFSPGGGLGITYSEDSPAPSIGEFAAVITSALTHKCEELGLEPPRLIVEPGRSIVGQAGVALYSVGAIKEVPGVRRYVSVDGGMADNIRPALYGARYEAVVANRMEDGNVERVTIAGRFCESGDVLIRDIDLPKIESGDIIAVPCCGAYCLPLASNYNASPRPAIVLVRDGRARLIRRRESYEDIMSHDV